MKSVVATAVFVVVVVELAALATLDRGRVLVAAGGAVALMLLALRWLLVQRARTMPEPTPADAAAESLRRWLSRTETLVSRADSTRRDWDRHLRPMLARQYELATGQKQNRNRSTFDATGRMLFGAELWQWVDPQNVARTDAGGPGPGRAALAEILERLERI